MSIFSHSATQVATQVQRVIEDKLVPNSIRDGWITNQHDEDGGGEQLIENIMEKLGSNIGARAERMYDWAKDHYIFGLPSATMHTSLAGKNASKLAIQQEVGGLVDMTYYHFGPLNLMHLAWRKLISNFGYNTITNEIGSLTAQKGYKVYLRDMQAIVKDATDIEFNAGTLDVWGLPPNSGPVPETGLQWRTGLKPTSCMVNPAIPTDYVRVDYSWEESVPTIVEGIQIPKKYLRTGSFNLVLPIYNMETDFHQARYIFNSKAYYWIYQRDAGTHPAVDAAFDAGHTDDGSFFPFGYVRFNKHNDTDNKDSDEYKSLNTLFDKLHMDFQSISDNVNSNPDIADVESAIMAMAVNVYMPSPIQVRYLFDFFSSVLPDAAPFPQMKAPNGIFDTLVSFDEAQARSTIIIQDKRFKMTLSFEGIVRNRIAGKITNKYGYSWGTDVDDKKYTIPVAGGGVKTVGNNRSQLWYGHQISENVYEEVRIYGLKTTYFIWAEYTTVGEGFDGNLLVPVDVNISKHYSMMEKEELYSRSLHFIFNSRLTVHLKWYQTGLFRVVLVIIAIICTILSDGTTWELIGEALAVGTLTVEAFIMIVVEYVLKQIITTVLIRLFIKEVGTKIAFIAAVIAALYGVYDGIEAGGIAGAPYASSLLTLSTNLTSGIDRQVQMDMNDLLHDKTDFERYVEQTTRVLETAEDLLNPTSRVNPLLIFGETPHDFYQRTVHSGNIGSVGIDAVSAYVDSALRLPKLSDTLGDHV